MANYIPNGWLLDAQDPGWTFGNGWSMDTAAGEIINDGTGSWDGCDYYEWEAIPPGYSGTIYWSIEVTEFTSGALEYFEICGISQTVPTGVGVYSGQIASGYDHHSLIFLRDDGGWAGKIKHVWVGDTPPPSGGTTTTTIVDKFSSSNNYYGINFSENVTITTIVDSFLFTSNYYDINFSEIITTTTIVDKLSFVNNYYDVSFSENIVTTTSIDKSSSISAYYPVNIFEENNTIINKFSSVSNYYDVNSNINIKSSIDKFSSISNYYDINFYEASETTTIVDKFSSVSNYYDVNLQINSKTQIDAGSYSSTHYDIFYSTLIGSVSSKTPIESVKYYSRLYDINEKVIIKTNNNLFEISNEFRMASEQEIATPLYLVEIELKRIDGITIYIRLSSGGKREYNGIIFGDNPYPSVDVKNLTSQTVSISLDNSGELYGFFAFSDEMPLKEQSLKIWHVYSDKYIIEQEKAMLRFDGYINGINEISEQKISFDGISQSISAAWCPRIRISPPLCNHLPKSGTKIGNLLLEPSK